jgi:sugar lactone lactonase YvrE
MEAKLICLGEPKAVLGEGPVWDVAEARLYWVDCVGKKLHRYDPRSEKTETWALPQSPGSYALRANGGGLIMAYRNGLALIDPARGKEEPLPTGPLDFAKERFNDGKCDRKGRFWTGTIDRRLKDPVGSLYRIDPDLSIRRMDTGITLSNGIAWSPDNKTMYYNDSRPGVIRAYDFDLETGSISNKRIFADFSDQKGRPDGCTIDAEGHLWVAEVGGGKIVRFDPSGRRVYELPLPITKPASVMFGGEGLRTLFIATMQLDFSEAELAAQPQTGCLFAADVGVAGLPESRFAG